MKRSRPAAIATLLRWLGPWAGERAPAGVPKRRVNLGALEVYIYGDGPREGRRCRGVAASENYRERVGRILLFGGFCEFEPTIRHAVFGERRDPLNSPVVFANLLWMLEGDARAERSSALLAGVDRAAVQSAWRAMVERTWGRPELKLPGAREPIAHEIASALGERERALFLAGCGLHDSARDLFERALDDVRGRLAFTDPRPHLARLAAPVSLIHGRDDDVIPFGEASKLSAALGAHPHRVLLTGMYGHTGSAVPGPRSMLAELNALFSILGALAG